MRAYSGNGILISGAEFVLNSVVPYYLMPAQNFCSAEGSPRLPQGDVCFPHPVSHPPKSEQRRCLQLGFVIHAWLAVSKGWGCEEGRTAGALGKIGSSLWSDLAYWQEVCQPWGWSVRAKTIELGQIFFRWCALDGRFLFSSSCSLVLPRKGVLFPLAHTLTCPWYLRLGVVVLFHLPVSAVSPKTISNQENLVVCASGSVIFLESNTDWWVLPQVVVLGDSHHIHEVCSMFWRWLHRRAEFQTNFIICGKSLLWWAQSYCKQTQ